MKKHINSNLYFNFNIYFFWWRTYATHPIHSWESQVKLETIPSTALMSGKSKNTPNQQPTLAQNQTPNPKHLCCVEACHI